MSEKLKDQSDKRLSSAARRIAGRLSMGEGDSRTKREKVAAGQMRSLANTLPKLNRGEQKNLSLSNIVETGYPDGPRGVIGVALMADVAVAVVAEKPKSRGNLPPIIKIVELPYGENSSSENDLTGKILASVNPEDLNSPGSDGVVQPWRSVVLGRGSSDPNVIKVGDDPELSREHLMITIGSNAEVSLRDISTNGTALITPTELYGGENPQLADFHSRLAENQMDWNTPMNSHAIVAS